MNHFRRHRTLIADLVAAGIALHLVAMALCPMPTPHAGMVKTPLGWFQICATGAIFGAEGEPAGQADKVGIDCPACDAICQFAMFIVASLTFALFVAAAVAIGRTFSPDRRSVSQSALSFRSRAPPFVV